MEFVKELADSRRKKESPETSYERAYVASGYATFDLAETAVLAVAPADIEFIPLSAASSEPYEGLDDTWRFDLTYRDESPTRTPASGESAYSFEAGAASVNVKQSLGTTAYGTGTSNDDYGNGVLYDPKEDRYLGADVTTPTFNFGETHYLAAANVTTAYISTVYGLVGRYNSTTFRGFAAGEVLFLGATGSLRTGALWEITYRFAASPNLTNLTFGQVTGVAKLGWQYLWAKYGDGSGEGTAFVAPPVEGIYVEDMYQPGNLAGLLLGTGPIT